MRRLTLLIALLVVSGGVALGQQVPMAGFWNTDISQKDGGTITFVAVPGMDNANVELALGGMPIGVPLADNGMNGDMTAGDGLYTGVIPVGPDVLTDGAYLVDVLNGGDVGWPYLNVLSAGPSPTATPSPTPSGPTPTPTPPGAVPTVVPGPRDCHPLSVGQCVLPFPSTFHLVPEANNVTGFKMAVPDRLPGDNSPDRLNTFDGFSQTSGLMAEFPGIIDPMSLPDFYAEDETVDPASPVLVANADPSSPNYGERIPVHAEVIDNRTNSLVVLRPARTLDENTRYIVGIRGLLDDQGNRIATSPEFAALRDGGTVNAETQRIQALQENVFDFLVAEGWTRAEIDLCWDFHTASDASTKKTMLHMVDEGVNLFNQTPKTLTITNRDQRGDGTLFTVQMQVPNFVRQNRTYELDLQGRPIHQGSRDLDVSVYVPNSVSNSTRLPAPGIGFGHGIFGSGSNVANSHIRGLEYVGISVDWEGFTAVDTVSIALDIFPSPIGNLPQMTDRLQQSVLNHILTSQALPELANLLETEYGKPILKADEFYFLGISLGGIMGSVYMAVHPDIEAGALLVPGGAWSHIMQRSSIWSDPFFAGVSFETYVTLLYPDAIDRTLLIAMQQSLWDPVDSISYAENWSKDPIGTRQQRHILVQEGVPDGTVPNFSTNKILRNANLPLLLPVSASAFQVAEVNPPTNGMYFGGCYQFPGADHGASEIGPAKEQKRKYFWSFSRPGEGFGPPGNIQGLPALNP